jgi:hypothetical protein
MTVFAIQYLVLMTFAAIAFWRAPIATPAVGAAAWGDSLSRYRRSMVSSYLYEGLAVAGVLTTGNVWLFMGCCLLMSAGLTWHRVGLAARVGPPPTVVRTFAATLEPRDRQAYRSIPLEVALAAATCAAAILICATQDMVSAKRSLAAPAMIFYIYTGLALARRAAVGARLFPIPSERAEEYFALRESARRLTLIAIDWLRALASSLLLCWSLLAAGILKEAASGRELSIPFWILYVMAMIDMSPRLWGFLLMRRALAMPSQPVRVDEKTRGLFRWNPDSPSMLSRGVHGWAMNLADPRTQLWLAYAVGFAAVIWMGVIA